MLICPHCGQQTAIPRAAEFAFIDVGRFTCEHYEKEFLVLHNVPMTEQEYAAKNIANESGRSGACNRASCGFVTTTKDMASYLNEAHALRTRSKADGLNLDFRAMS
jgi:hypothetical protein